MLDKFPNKKHTQCVLFCRISPPKIIHNCARYVSLAETNTRRCLSSRLFWLRYSSKANPIQPIRLIVCAAAARWTVEINARSLVWRDFHILYTLFCAASSHQLLFRAVKMFRGSNTDGTHCEL